MFCERCGRVVVVVVGKFFYVRRKMSTEKKACVWKWW